MRLGLRLEHVRTFFAAMVICLGASLAWGEQDSEPSATDQEMAFREAVDKIEKSLKFQTGTVTVGDGLATVHVPEAFRYLGPDDARKVIEMIWGNPEGSGSETLGMLVPADVSPAAAESWGVIMTYQEDGYVSDEDAESIDYDELLKTMQSSMRDANESRAEMGYPPMELVGWAMPPRYDQEAHKMYWAKRLRFEGDSAETLNYNIRVLGRSGVLVLNAVSAMEQLDEVKAKTPEILEAVAFVEGKRYEDFNAATDHVADYGLAALVAGGVAAKTGVFKALWLGILAFKKFIFIGLVALVGFVVSWFRGSGQKEE